MGSSTIHGHVDPCTKSGWNVKLQKKNGSWSNIDTEFTDGSSNVTFIYSGGYPATLRIFCQGGGCGGDDYDEDTAPTSSGLTFYEEQEVWFTLNLPKIPSDDPPSVSTQAATSIGWDNGTFHATLNGTVTHTGGATVVERGFDWGYSTGNYPYEVTEEGSWGTGAFDLVDNGMNAKVYFRAKARNSEGWGYGGELSFDPPPRPPSLECWTPLDLDWDNGTFHGTLDATMTDDGGEEADERGFDWGYSSGNYPYEWTEEDGFGIGNFDHYISGLTDKVYFRAKAHNSAGWGYSSEKSFDPPPRDLPTVTTQDADFIMWENGKFQGTLHGTITDTGNGTCDRRGFQWGYSTGNYPYSYSYENGFGTGSFWHIATDLDSETIYFRAMARNSAGWGYGSEKSFNKPDIATPTVTTQAATGIDWDNGTFHATLHGTITAIGGENCNERGFDWGYSPGNYSAAWTEEDSYGIGAFNRYITSLTGIPVYFRAKAHNTAGWGYGSEMSFSPPCWLSGWAKRVKLTIDHTDITSTLVNFPVLVYLSTESGRNGEDVTFVFDELEHDGNRKRIAITTGDGITECYIEIEKWDHASEKAWLWVKVPSIASDEDTDLYLYYDITHDHNLTYVGDPDSTQAENVWNANFKAVIHMRDDPDNAHVRDSTEWENEGAKKGVNEPLLTAAGKIGEAQDFDGDDDFIGIADSQWLDLGGSGAISIWVKHAVGSLAVIEYILNADTEQAGRWAIWGTTLDKFAAQFRDADDNLITGAALISTTSLDTGEHLIRLEYDGTTLSLYVDGDLEDSAVDVGKTIHAIGGTVYIGKHPTAGQWWEGPLDEFRAESTSQGAAWAKADYESGRDDLLDFGSEETTVDIVTMIGGPTGYVWGEPLAQLSVVKRTTDGGLSYTWTTIVGTVTIPNGGPEAWIWDEITIYVEG